LGLGVDQPAISIRWQGGKSRIRTLDYKGRKKPGFFLKTWFLEEGNPIERVWGCPPLGASEFHPRRGGYFIRLSGRGLGNFFWRIEETPALGFSRQIRVYDIKAEKTGD
jgi:hypothetical protein